MGREITIPARGFQEIKIKDSHDLLLHASFDSLLTSGASVPAVQARQLQQIEMQLIWKFVAILLNISQQQFRRAQDARRKAEMMQCVEQFLRSIEAHDEFRYPRIKL